MEVNGMLKDNLKQIREANGLTKRELCEKTGISERAYLTYEYGEREPKISVIEKLADFYGVTTDYILGRDNVLSPFEEIISRINENTKTMDVIEMYGQLPENVQQAIINFMSSLLEKRETKEKPVKQRHVERLGDIEDELEQERQAKAKDGTSCA